MAAMGELRLVEEQVRHAAEEADGVVGPTALLLLTAVDVAYPEPPESGRTQWTTSVIGLPRVGQAPPLVFMT